MTEILDRLLAITHTTADFMWGEWMVVLLVGTGILLSFLTGFIQIRRLRLSLSFVTKGALGKDKTETTEGDISPFAALMTALAATVGNGNIAGVATAIATGGPGAPFWMWLSGFFGMATKYSECFLGVKFRQVAEDGTMAGGPMYYIRRGIKNQPVAKILGATFAVCGGMTALFGTGNMAQSNSMALAFQNQFGIPPLLSGIVLTVLTGLVIIGGIKRIGAVAERLVPGMIIFYFLGAIIIVVVKFTEIPAAFALIFKSAFTPQAVAGGIIGTSIKQAISLGVRRGVLSNEAGMGSAAIAQAAARSPYPTYNGLVGMTGVFIDTIVVNTLTTLSIVLTGVWKLTPAAGLDLLQPGTTLAADKIAALPPHVQQTATQIGYNLANGGLSSTALTASAFDSVVPFGGWIVALGSFLFGYTTLIGWAYYGEICLEYLFGVRSKILYRYAYIGLLFIGAILTGRYLDIVWYVGDTFNAIMALPNLIGLLILAKVVARTTRTYYKSNVLESLD